MGKRPYTLLWLGASAALGWHALIFPVFAQEETGDVLAQPGQPKFAEIVETDIELFNQTISDKNRIKSVFYTQAEITDIHLAINTYLKNSGRGGKLNFDEEAFLSRLGSLKKPGATQSVRFYTYPQFFLDSLVYHSPSEWTIWLNGNKITQDTPKESSNIHVVGIDQSKVAFEWFPLEIERVEEVWSQIPNDEVSVDVLRGKVSFTLRPNQTFSSYVMKVLEGRVLPVTVDTAQIRKTPVTETAEDPSQPTIEPRPLPVTPSAPPDSDSSEGLSGLINSYRNIKTGDE